MHYYILNVNARTSKLDEMHQNNHHGKSPLYPVARGKVNHLHPQTSPYP
jgi:hypothetical protein